ncbi:hypothetical protein D0863_07994 [Hortaea werneckii]|uniref:Uncharacterized protein n=1 Tax=Hortaea werneckii TaxID=91943 RepID=A0A3M7DSV5_HORWE|nr:hypothetical protein D0863_07994 [Hortaea werneckii]
MPSMAEKPRILRDAAKNGEQTRSTSHGRGGAGNINSVPSTARTADDMRTPEIKQPHYTTGRGGTGNIVSNDNPSNARLAQDVEAPRHHDRPAQGTFHWGRGGEGNMTVVGKSEREQRKEREEQRKKEGGRSNSRGEAENRSQSRRRGSGGLIEKGKEILGIGGRGRAGGSENAIEEEKA